MVDFEKIKELREKINQLLEEHPELKPLQDEINERLAKIPSTDYQRRNQVIQEFMFNTWSRIVKVWEGK